MPRPVRTVLSIAGSDSGGGAGIQADLKAFARCGVHGMTAITALTAQSTIGRHRGSTPVPGEFIVEQVRTVVEDIGVDAVKIGMLGTADTVRAVREALGHIGDGVPIVIDPVMVAESGAVLLDDEARAAIVRRAAAAGDRDHAEPARGAGAGAGGDAELRRRRGRWRARCTRSGPATWSSPAATATRSPTSSSTARRSRYLSGERHPDGAAHGSGCTHSSALAAHLALGFSPLRGGAGGAADRVRRGARRPSRGIGRGHRARSTCSGVGRAGASTAWRDRQWAHRRA